MTFPRSRWSALLVAAAVVAFPTRGAAQEDTRPIVAIWYFENNSIGAGRADFDGLERGIADLLITDLSTAGRVRVVEREQIQKILQEQGLVRERTIDDATAIRLGKLLGASYSITGGFMSDGRNTMILTARAINLETSEISNTQREQTRGDDVLGLITRMSQRLSTDLRLPGRPRDLGQAAPAGAPAAGAPAPAQAGTAPPARMGSRLDVRTALLYSKALEEMDSGNNRRAVELFTQVTEKFPDFTPAKEKLEQASKTGD